MKKNMNFIYYIFKYILTHPAPSSSRPWCSHSSNKGWVDLDCGIINDVSQLSEFSGRSFSTDDDVEPTGFDKMAAFPLWLGIK